MNKYSKLIPTAPYRILEAIWYQSIHGKINEADFKFPYINKAKVDVAENIEFEKKLISLSGSELIFELVDQDGHRAEFLIQATPVRKNESEISYTLINSNLNGTKSKVLGWLIRTFDEVNQFYVELRKAA